MNALSDICLKAQWYNLSEIVSESRMTVSYMIDGRTISWDVGKMCHITSVTSIAVSLRVLKRF